MEDIIKVDLNMVAFVQIIFGEGLARRNKKLKKYSLFLLSRATARGYKGDIISAFNSKIPSKDLVQKIADFSSYLCVNDFQKMIMNTESSSDLSFISMPGTPPYWHGNIMN